MIEELLDKASIFIIKINKLDIKFFNILAIVITNKLLDYIKLFTNIFLKK